MASMGHAGGIKIDRLMVSSLMSAIHCLPRHAMRSSTSTAGIEITTYFSSSFSFATSNDSSQPTSIKTLTPPSSSSRDCDADDSDCAPCNEQKVNIFGKVACYLFIKASTTWILLVACSSRIDYRKSDVCIIE
jgi:hypothetical protein